MIERSFAHYQKRCAGECDVQAYPSKGACIYTSCTAEGECGAGEEEKAHGKSG